MVDRDFLEEIKHTEAEAASRIENAREEAQLQRQMARQQAGELIDGAYRKAGAIRQEKMKQAEKQYHDLVSGNSSSHHATPIRVPEDTMAKTAEMLAERIVSILEHR